MRALLLIWLVGSVSVLRGQAIPGFNYDEAKVGTLPIPDPLTCDDGSRVATAEEWTQKRRPELLRLFEREVYGKTPAAKLADLRFVTLAEDKHALGGAATRREVTVYFNAKGSPRAEILLYLPNKPARPVPVFVSLSFRGNHSVANDPAIRLPAGWFPDDEPAGFVAHKATEQSRGSAALRWPIAQIIARGYGVATAYYGDFEPDHNEGMPDGVRALFLKPGQTAPAADEWGAIGAWAWGLSRMADYLVTLPAVDPNKLAVLGHSRLGKAALWAGAQDPRFALVISNNSGAGGAALSKRAFGETAARLNRSFPNWFCGNFNKYSDHEGALPVDQHELIALIAPRPVYIASATEDLWSDPTGEFLGGKLAEPVYALFGKKGLGLNAPPPADHSVGDFIGYHSRTGKHDILIFDWEQYMNFADHHWGKPE
ncbi:MAG: acetylxylan esterase [Verrucomicrobiota bacterium]